MNCPQSFEAHPFARLTDLGARRRNIVGGDGSANTLKGKFTNRLDDDSVFDRYQVPLILAPTDYTCWLSDEPDPGDLMMPFPAEPMRRWSISTRVNKPENDDPSIVEPIAIATSAA